MTTLKRLSLLAIVGVSLQHFKVDRSLWESEVMVFPPRCYSSNPPPFFMAHRLGLSHIGEFPMATHLSTHIHIILYDLPGLVPVIRL